MLLFFYYVAMLAPLWAKSPLLWVSLFDFLFFFFPTGPFRRCLVGISINQQIRVIFFPVSLPRLNQLVSIQWLISA